MDRLNGQLPCHITFTTNKTAEIIKENLHKSPIYSGEIEGVGPRYCPSIEDKIVRFADKDRHQIFLEPEGIATDEMYVNGFSTCLPFDVQYEMVRTISYWTSNGKQVENPLTYISSVAIPSGSKKIWCLSLSAKRTILSSIEGQYRGPTPSISPE